MGVTTMSGQTASPAHDEDKPMMALRGKLMRADSATLPGGGFLVSLTLRDQRGGTIKCLARDRVAHVAASLLRPDVDLAVLCERGGEGDLVAIAVAAV